MNDKHITLQSGSAAEKVVLRLFGNPTHLRNAKEAEAKSGNEKWICRTS